MKLLCLSNGHGEDAIAVRILRELQNQPNPPELAALPLVGEGRAYDRIPEVPIIGPMQSMPSGGFVYMDGRQLWRDLRGGLLKLTLAQMKVVKRWAKDGGQILAVGDIVPLLFAWWSGADYSFVGTAKSEYYLRDDIGWLPRRTWFERWESWSGSVYLPWERWLMGNKRCQAVFPRDSLTTEILQKYRIRAFDLGNPMMDEIAPEDTGVRFTDRDSETKEMNRAMTVVLLPGSRSREAYENWQPMMLAVTRLREAFADRRIVFLGAIAPGLEIEPFQKELETYGWRVQPGNLSAASHPIEDNEAIVFGQSNATLVLSQHAFAQCLRLADFAVAMAGTATEQFVGLGKPALAIPGRGPQFTPAFAQAQSRHLGSSLILVDHPDRVADSIGQILRDPDRLQLIADNGRRRMGKPGAARRIAECLMERSIAN
ncbi:MAG: lipid-A-disaccharide synthase-related protein [Cyanobacteriota bacterium]|nr:lipid-A-disaccharide synthase-related protein [Cyanobacteriota bacterium]